jgi:hypothetical protein
MNFAAKSVDSSKPTSVRILALDFSSAFDTIKHKKLIQRCVELGFPYWLLRFLISFLSGRFQIVIIDDAKSGKLRITVGSPQGEVLSPDCFTILTDDVRADSSQAMLIKFADDSTIVATIRDKLDQANYQHLINGILEQFGDAKDLIINSDKTKELIVDFTKLERITNSVPPTLVLGQLVQRVKDLKLLGFTVSDDLKPDTHIKNALSKANQHLYLLYKMADMGLPAQALTNFYQGGILSPLEYAAPVFHHATSQADVKKIERVRKRAFKCITRVGGAFKNPFPLCQRRDKLCKSYFAKLLSKSSSLIPPVKQCKNGYYIKAPYARTKRYSTSFVQSQIQIFNSDNIANPETKSRYANFVRHS